MQEGSLVSFVDSKRSGIYVVECVDEEEYLEKVRNDQPIERTQKVWHLYDMLDKQKKIWKAFGHEIQPHSFERAKRGSSQSKKGKKIRNVLKPKRNTWLPLDILCEVALQTFRKG
jgi:hypothetical protein